MDTRHQGTEANASKVGHYLLFRVGGKPARAVKLTTLPADLVDSAAKQIGRVGDRFYLVPAEKSWVDFVEMHAFVKPLLLEVFNGALRHTKRSSGRKTGRPINVGS